MRIIVDDLSGAAIAEFLADHIRQMRSITPEESKHALDLDGLRAPDITFWTSLDGDVIVGCAALKRLDPDHAEVKSMRTAPTRRRSGVASALMRHLIDQARQAGYRRLSLETGSADFFRPARALYRTFGFDYCEPFGDYAASPHNVFMTRVL